VEGDAISRDTIVRCEWSSFSLWSVSVRPALLNGRFVSQDWEISEVSFFLYLCIFLSFFSHHRVQCHVDCLLLYLLHKHRRITMAATANTENKRTGTTTTSTSRNPRILLGVTGSVAAVKAPEIACRLVQECDAHVKILLSEGGRNFWEKAHEYNAEYWNQLQELLKSKDTDTLQVIEAADEWKAWDRLGDPVLHIELRDWAHVLVLAPLSAHSLAKIAHGLCDDTLSCVARAWDFGHYKACGTSANGTCTTSSRSGGKPVILAPAMNTAMWEHPLTRQQLETIQSFAGGSATPTATATTTTTTTTTKHSLVQLVAPQSKLLACGEVGNGALAPVDVILQKVRSVLDDFQLT